MCQIEAGKQLKYTHNLGVLRLKHKCDDNFNNNGRTARVMTYFGERQGSSTKRVQYTIETHKLWIVCIQYSSICTGAHLVIVVETRWWQQRKITFLCGQCVNRVPVSSFAANVTFSLSSHILITVLCDSNLFTLILFWFERSSANEQPAIQIDTRYESILVSSTIVRNYFIANHFEAYRIFE